MGSEVSRGLLYLPSCAIPTTSRSDVYKRQLYYFSTDLSDGGVKNSGFLQFCAKLGPADSFLKSASYLLHSGGFTRVRRFLIDRSATILQDDSGIPLAYFDAKRCV